MPGPHHPTHRDAALNSNAPIINVTRTPSLESFRHPYLRVHITFPRTAAAGIFRTNNIAANASSRQILFLRRGQDITERTPDGESFCERSFFDMIYLCGSGSKRGIGRTSPCEPIRLCVVLFYASLEKCAIVLSKLGIRCEAFFTLQSPRANGCFRDSHCSLY